MGVILALLVAALGVRAVGGNVRRARAWAVLSLAVGLASFDLALPWVWTWPAPELGTVVVSCALLGGFGGWLLLPLCERLAVGLLRWGSIGPDPFDDLDPWSEAARLVRARCQQGLEAGAEEEIARQVRAAFLLPVEVAGRLVRDVREVI